MTADDESAPQSKRARFHFSLVGQLLSRPPQARGLRAAIEELARQKWTDPVSGEVVQFTFPTLERWYYSARNAKDPVGTLRRKVRKDLGLHPSMPVPLRAVLQAQYRDHASWSVQLHYDNLGVLVEENQALGRLPSYSTVRRYLGDTGLVRQPRRLREGTAGEQAAERRLQDREVRSFEATHVCGLWHLDFHQGSLPVLTKGGAWVAPQAFCVLDDRSRLGCHVQWYLTENTENLAHGWSQACQKRGLPRAQMMDNGSGMVAAETQQGLGRLGVVPEMTLAHSPYQNGKQETFWEQVEGRAVAMLEGVRNELTLQLLNDATQAWVEMEYNREVHSETGQTPLQRWLDGPEVSRPSPSAEELRQAFRLDQGRTVRKSDGTVSILGTRFEIPAHCRALEKVTVRYARWDLGLVHLVDPRTDTLLCRIYPLDRARNADGKRRLLAPTATVAGPPPASGIAPLLKKLMAEYAATGHPPAYLPKDDIDEEEEP